MKPKTLTQRARQFERHARQQPVSKSSPVVRAYKAGYLTARKAADTNLEALVAEAFRAGEHEGEQQNKKLLLVTQEKLRHIDRGSWYLAERLRRIANIVNTAGSQLSVQETIRVQELVTNYLDFQGFPVEP